MIGVTTNEGDSSAAVVIDTLLVPSGGEPAVLRKSNFAPPVERPVMRWSANPFIIDGASFPLPYWLGRYQKLLVGE